MKKGSFKRYIVIYLFLLLVAIIIENFIEHARNVTVGSRLKILVVVQKCIRSSIVPGPCYLRKDIQEK